MKKVTVEYCIGIGTNMLFPEFIKHTYFVEYGEDDLIPFDLVMPQLDLVSDFPIRELEEA